MRLLWRPQGNSHAYFEHFLQTSRDNFRNDASCVRRGHYVDSNKSAEEKESRYRFCPTTSIVGFGERNRSGRERNKNSFEWKNPKSLSSGTARCSISLRPIYLTGVVIGRISKRARSSAISRHLPSFQCIHVIDVIPGIAIIVIARAFVGS